MNIVLINNKDFLARKLYQIKAATDSSDRRFFLGAEEFEERSVRCHLSKIEIVKIFM